MARGKTLHDVHGERLSLDEAAERLGVTRRALEMYRWRNRCTLEAAWDHYVAWKAQGKPMGRPEAAHCVHGEWLTPTEAAKRLGYARRTLVKYRYEHKCLLEEAWDHYDALNRGWIQTKAPGPRPRTGWLGARRVTPREAAKALDVSLSTMYRYIRDTGSIAGAARAIEARREDAAVREIVKAITERGTKE